MLCINTDFISADGKSHYVSENVCSNILQGLKKINVYDLHNNQTRINCHLVHKINMNLIGRKAGCYVKKKAGNKNSITYTDRNGYGKTETDGGILGRKNRCLNREIQFKRARAEKDVQGIKCTTGKIDNE